MELREGAPSWSRSKRHLGRWDQCLPPFIDPPFELGQLCAFCTTATRVSAKTQAMARP